MEAFYDYKNSFATFWLEHLRFEIIFFNDDEDLTSIGDVRRYCSNYDWDGEIRLLDILLSGEMVTEIVNGLLLQAEDCQCSICTM